MSPTQSRRSEAAPAQLVVKIGGSLWASPQLLQWLAALRRAPFAITIVPGGGIFADAVRAAQQRMRFSDEAAHRMALLAMEQYALAIADLDPQLTLVSSVDETRAAHLLGRTAVWRPFEIVCAARQIPASWDVTSDSLAAWFASKAGASTLLLIKSVDASQSDDLASLGVVDPYFSHYAKNLSAYVAGPSSLVRAAGILARGDIPGTAIHAGFSGRKIAI
jgi:dihydroneopterin aldolase